MASAPPLKSFSRSPKSKGSTWELIQTLPNTMSESWNMFTARERWNIAVYICGIMMYKFGLEAFNGSVVALATNRYDYESVIHKTKSKTFERVGLLTGLNQACQCVGSVLIAPLVKRFPPKWILVVSILGFGAWTAVLMIMDAATGGTFAPAKYRKKHPPNSFEYYGTYNTNAIIPVYAFAGIVYGMIELMRRVIPRDIVGGNVQKLRRMDALVHIFYEVSGTAGAFCTALALIPRFGNNYSFLITPICFVFAAVTWSWIFDVKPTRALEGESSSRLTPIENVKKGIWLFFNSAWTGAYLIFSQRKFSWLVFGYSVAMYAHRFLENNICAQVARRYMGNAAWSQIMVGGSNLGELLGAGSVFLFTNAVPTPMPFLRLDALTLLIPWYFAYWYIPRQQVKYAWIGAASLIPVSFGWAAGDVSLAAYIQASIARLESSSKEVSALGAVMAFLYSTYIIIYAITSPLLGKYVDHVYNNNGREKGGDIHVAIRNIGGVQFTIISSLILASTFIPAGSCAFNPQMLANEKLESDAEGNRESARSEEYGEIPRAPTSPMSRP